MRPVRIAFAAGLLLAAAAIAGIAQPHFASSAEPTPSGAEITVSGTGSVTTVPDRGSFDFSVERRAKTATDALARNTAATNAIVDALKGAGVSSDDLRTAYVSLSQQLSDDGQSVVGFVASNTVTATVRDLARAGRIVDAGIGAGATGLSGPSLERGDVETLYRTALKAAVTQARAKAEAAADAAGLRVGAVKQIVENSASPQPLPGVVTGKDSGIVIQPGTQSIEASVSVTFAAT